MFKVNNKDSITTSMTSFCCLYCWLWTCFIPFPSISIVEFEHISLLGCAYILEHHWLHWWEINHNPKIQPVLKMYPAFRILNNFFKKKWNSHNLLQNTKKVTRKNTYGRGQGAGWQEVWRQCWRAAGDKGRSLSLTLYKFQMVGWCPYFLY